MSWQRVDEDTYIDDTLVTCAEYQIFINEMLEQEKYYQPDHWKSYEFPPGQAREPILGVRSKDAQAFCVWLNLRDTGKWFYRLPKKEETAFSLLLGREQLSGYWLQDRNFVWAGAAPVETWLLDVKRVRDVAFSQAKYLASALSRTRDNSLELSLSLDLANVSDRNRKLARELSLFLAVTQCLEKELELNRIPIIQFGSDSIEENLTAGRNSDQHSVEDTSELLLSLNDAFSRKLETNHVLQLTAILHLTLETDPSRNHNLIIGLVFLQERLEGRSPAFEGIRLVKERIR